MRISTNIAIILLPQGQPENLRLGARTKASWEHIAREVKRVKDRILKVFFFNDEVG